MKMIVLIGITSNAHQNPQKEQDASNDMKIKGKRL
jgi:hypothetical protein